MRALDFVISSPRIANLVHRTAAPWSSLIPVPTLPTRGDSERAVASGQPWRKQYSGLTRFNLHLATRELTMKRFLGLRESSAGKSGLSTTTQSGPRAISLVGLRKNLCREGRSFGQCSLLSEADWDGHADRAAFLLSRQGRGGRALPRGNRGTAGFRPH